MNWDAITFMTTLSLNVPGDCGSLRPTRVEPQLHCVGIAWQMQGRCDGSAGTHLSMQLWPTHSVRPTQLNRGPRISRAAPHLASHALIVQSAHFEWACALWVGSRTWRLMLSYPFPCNYQHIQFAIQANHTQYYLKSIPFFNLRWESEPLP